MKKNQSVKAGERTREYLCGSVGPAQHTPGPWGITRTITGSKENVVLRGNDGAGRKIYDAMVEAENYAVAGVGGVGRDECLANARLIAAAPELLDALKEYLRSHNACGHCNCRTCDAARAVLTKATTGGFVGE